MRNNKSIQRLVAAAIALTVTTTGLTTAKATETVAKPPPPQTHTEATFEGTTFNMAENWGQAQACLVWETNIPECFRTEQQLNKRIAQLDANKPTSNNTGPTAAASGSCSSSLRLYKNSSYGGTSLSLYNKTGWINLSLYGFDQSVSSFKVGACDVQFADLSNGGGSWFASWRSNAYDVAATISGGWDNDFSSVRIY